MSPKADSMNVSIFYLSILQCVVIIDKQIYTYNSINNAENNKKIKAAYLKIIGCMSFGNIMFIYRAYQVVV